VAAGVLTKSKCPSAPVEWCRQILPGGTARVLIVNSGNANAFTGMKGEQAVRRTVEEAVAVSGASEDEVYLASTGVIGEPLDADKFGAVLSGCVERLSGVAWRAAAEAIMTTDTFPKLATRRVDFGGVEVILNGIAKGSGMIAPDLGTMLAFVFTDAPLEHELLQELLARGVRDSFNAITVDSDTSTSDTVLLFATGAARGRGAKLARTTTDRHLGAFTTALNDLLADLARQVVRDGEGARKFVTVKVQGAESRDSAHRIAMSIANSPLVKTAVAGEDANWGRVVMAVGKAGEPADRDRLSIWFGPHRVAVDGMRDPDYDEERLSAYMRNEEIELSVDLGIGRGGARVWTCDLTDRYIAINADYRS
jgi:glutamate N-acetyltransferase/amino-acid N-acetyltransferase